MRILYVGMCTGDNGFTQAMKKQAEYREINCGHPEVNALMLAEAVSFKPDFVFIQVQTPGIIEIHTLGMLESMGIKTYNFSGDIRATLPDWYKELGAHFTSSLFTNMNDVETMRSLGYESDWIEYGFDPAIYNPNGPVKPVADIVFMGNNYGERYFPLSTERKVTVDLMKAKFGKNFAVFGSGWDNADGNVNHSQTEEASIYRGARIAINLSHVEAKQYSSDRLLRILGTGTMCICKWFPEIEKRFKDNVHLRTYYSTVDLYNLCNYYLDNPQERKEIAQMGALLAHTTYTFDHMVTNLIKLHEAKSNSLYTSNVW